MPGLLWLVPALPLASFVVLALTGRRMSNRAVAALGSGSVGAAAVVAMLAAAAFIANPPAGHAYTEVLWTWMSTSGFAPQIALRLDPLSLIMMLVVTFVGFLIHVYSTEFMAGDDGYSRFFAYMNLFVASMITLVLASDLLLLLLGWEGVGLCSYLLIGFWYRDPANGAAGQKAFIVTRVGDTAFLIGLFLLFTNLRTLDIQETMRRALAEWPQGSALAIASAALLLGGAVGKSAQLPLQTWLPDAMAGPTPTSALIHAATMVTAGVYLIARTHVLFELAPPVLFAVAVIGAATLLLAGFSALTQNDIKRVLAYSTISQIGYMFLALGVGAWASAIFHFMTHAFFKALLFLAAGIVIDALHHEHNIFRMGGLRRRLSVAFWTFVIGGSALAGLPLITSGFYSKDRIIWDSLMSDRGGAGLWVVGIIGVFLTSLYIFRLIFIVFFGEARTEVEKRPGLAMVAPVVVLSVLSIVGGWVPGFFSFLEPTLPALEEFHGGALTETTSSAIAAGAFIAGLGLACFFFLRRGGYVVATSFGRAMHNWWFAGWGFDRLYDRVFVRPVLWFARIGRGDFFNSIYDGLASLAASSWRLLSRTETGLVRWYAAGVAVGTVVLVAIALLL
jgi:NADH-quinone oxidoreductase subunit L